MPLKDAVVDAALAKRGMDFERRGVGGRLWVLNDAYDAGHEAGDRFAYRAGLIEES